MTLTDALIILNAVGIIWLVSHKLFGDK